MASSPKIDELRKKFEENPRRYFAPLANEYRKAGDTEQAIAICREYLPQQPGHMSGHIVFGQALFEAKQLDEAKTVFETALSLDPENLIALKHLGDITAALGDKEAAMGWYRRVLDADPRNEETQALLAKLEGPKAAPAATPATAQDATPVSKTMPMPAAKPGAAGSAPTVVMQAMRPLPKLGATGLPMPAVPKPTTATSATTATTSKPTPVQSLSTQPTVPFEVPKVAAPEAPAAPPPPAALAPTQEIRMDGLTHGADSASKVAAGSSAVAATVIMEAAPGMKPVSAADTPVVVPAMGLETTAVAQGDAPPIDSFSLDGLETTSMAPPPAVPAAAPMETAPAMDLDLSVPPPLPVAAPPAPAPEIDLALPDAPAPPAPAAEPMPAIDLDFAAPAAASAPSAPASAPVGATPAADDPGLVDLDIGLSSPGAAQASPAPEAAVASPAPAAPAPELIDVALDIPAAAPAVETPGAAPAPAMTDLELEVSAPAPQSGPFVTETMAELYLQQGHREEALRVYRALLDQRPGDAGIAAKIAELSQAPMTPPPVPATALPPLSPAAGPTIRAVLMLIAMRRPGYRPEPGNGNGAVHAESHEPPPTASAPVEHSPDALSALWNHATPAADEEDAALVLSAAFADLDGATHGNGAMDLSSAAAAAAAAQAASAAALAAGVPAAPSSFSFDKFFSQRATAEHAAQADKSGAPNARSESRDDVAHFTQWLEGLKQR